MKSKAIIAFLSTLIIPVILTNCIGRVQGPGMRLSSEKYDFGGVVEGASVRHSFVFTNNGTEKLLVTEVSSTCGCTVAGAWAKTVAPGATWELPVTLRISADVRGALRVAAVDADTCGDCGASVGRSRRGNHLSS